MGEYGSILQGQACSFTIYNTQAAIYLEKARHSALRVAFICQAKDRVPKEIAAVGCE